MYALTIAHIILRRRRTCLLLLYVHGSLYVLKRCLALCVCVITYGHECRVCIQGARSADWARVV